MYFVVLCCDKASSPSSNELSIAMGSTPKVQPIAMKFAERKHLMPSNNKFARPQNPHLRLSKLRFFGLRSAAIKRGQRLLADYAERER